MNTPKEKDGALESLKRDIMMMKDPALGYVPTERLLAAKEYRDNLWQSQTNAAISGVTWRTLGPKNLGGRTRALLVDANDATGNTIWAGSVGGGLWKTTDITAASPNWAPADDFFSNLAITGIAQDPSTPNTLYFCTGEGYFNIDYIQGLGVWKSTNGGTTWTQLASTNNSNFYLCQRIVVNSTGVIMVATSTGLRRSADGGTTWTKVLGTGLGITGAVSNFCYDVDIAANGDVYATLDGSVHKSTNAGVTFGAAQTLGISAGRVELACAPSDANYVYAVVEFGSGVNGILRTTNGGTTWTSRTEPADADPGCPAADFSNGQAWYNLTVAVDPLNRDAVFVGGLDIFKSTDGAGTWTQIGHWYGGFGFPYVHADNHFIVFKPGSSSVAYFTNDGGVFRTANADNATPAITDKGPNYVTGQFYSCAIHPTAFTSYFLGGTQDNGTHQFTQPTLQNTSEVTGGDGGFCHIDQDQPQFQWTSYVFNDFYTSTNGGSSWTNVTTGGGSFISPTDYDDANNKLYMCNAAGSYRRWDDPQTGGSFAASGAIAAFGGGNVTAVRVSPNTAHRVFFGIDNGRVVRVDNANTGAPTSTNISTGLPAGFVSCVEVETGNDNHLLVTYSNYGLNSIWESTNGGTSWSSVEGNLPDMPIRWALFNPNNNDQAMIATELGVWTTDNLNAGATNWGTSNSGLANVRVDMLQYRTSDKMVVAATHGRGLFTSDAFTTPTALFSSDIQTTYIGMPVSFTSSSYRATSWNWTFGDAGTSTSENPTHSYSSAGLFSVTLSINSGASSLTKTSYIHVLPNRGTPYSPANGGNFEANVNDFGSMAIRGGIDKWERGVPSNALVTVNSAPNAWKTDLDADLTEGDYACVLMTPNYNFTAAGVYQLRFRRSMEIAFCNAPFAVQCQYTTDKGRPGPGWA
ncbi:MAG: PKD domain-containing protein [Chitinophagaceae bacterium]|nr:PKD domain-containing protein [Chitinophagaceae bacterium]